MHKHLDDLFIKDLVSKELYKIIFIRSLGQIVEESNTYISDKMSPYLQGTLTNISAIGGDDMTLQKSNIEDRDIISNIARTQYETYIYHFDNHIEQLEEFKVEIQRIREASRHTDKETV